jgi:hypothetical protein
MKTSFVVVMKRAMKLLLLIVILENTRAFALKVYNKPQVLNYLSL